MFKKEKATKERVKLMIGLCGPSGSGKTYSALQMAYGITGDWSKIAVIDTENRSSLNYAGSTTSNEWDIFDFSHDTFEGGYRPENWVRAIDIVEKDPANYEVLIIDSITHEWLGCLELVEQFSKTERGNTFTPWKKVTPLHNAFIDKMRNSRLHIIATMRSSTEYAMETNEKGRTVPKKIGTKPTQREGTDYEFSLIFDLDNATNHATSSKDRTGLFKTQTQPPFLITIETGKKIVDWCNDGVKSAREIAIEKAKKDREDALEKSRNNAIAAFMSQGNVNEFIAKDVVKKITKREKISDISVDDLHLLSAKLGELKSGLEWDSMVELLNQKDEVLTS